MDLKQQIINDINENPIILYMKGYKRYAYVWLFKFSSTDFESLWC